MILAWIIAPLVMQPADKDDDPIETACLERDQSQQGMNRCAGDAL